MHLEVSEERKTSHAKGAKGAKKPPWNASALCAPRNVNCPTAFGLLEFRSLASKNLIESKTDPTWSSFFLESLSQI
jgi:hypothetical protein